ncbi:MAG: hypothetical protein ACK5AY_00585 [Bacteroidota bacterium]
MFPFFLFSQFKVSYFLADKSSEQLKKKYPLSAKNWSEANKYAKDIVADFRSNGFLLSNTDSIIKDTVNSEIKIFIFIGEKFTWAKLVSGNLDEEAIAASALSEKLLSGKIFNPKEVTKLMYNILRHYENNGYPFAEVSLDSVLISETSISAKIKVEKNRKVIIDSVIVFGDLNISKNFLYRYLNLRSGCNYDEAVINKVSSRLRLLPFVNETKPVSVRLTDRYNRLIIFADKRNASQFDGIVGLLPSNGSKTVFTGDLKIKLVNTVFKSGETMELNWRRLQSETQDLKTKIVYPFIFNSPFGVEHQFKLYKRDSTFLDLNNNIGVNYFFSGLNYLKALYKQRNAFVLSKSVYVNTQDILELADITTRAYGIGFFYENFDYKLNPRKGLSVSVNTTAGSRSIKRNPNIDVSFYSTLKLSAVQYQFDLDFSSFIPIMQRSAIKIGLQSATVYSDKLFINEMFRIGGLKTLRGFDEESIFSSSYAIGTVEYRFLFEKNSSLFLFSDLCWYEKKETSSYVNDLPVGIGAGINFETKAGIFSLTYALGNQFNNGFDIRSGKIHFGIVNSF